MSVAATRHIHAPQDGAPVRSALISSRLIVCLAGAYGILAVGYRPTGSAPVTHAPLGDLGELLLGPAVRWDGGFYTSIAVHGYHAGAVQAFFPLYPLAIAAVRFLLGSALVSAIVVSLGCLAISSILLHRLAERDFGKEAARLAVLALALAPASLYFSMAYPEALLLALTLGAVYAARTERWWLAGTLGALASATHESGVLIAVPLALMYLYGPRGEHSRDPSPVAGPRGAHWRDLVAVSGPDGPRRRDLGTVSRLAPLRPRYPLKADVLWLTLTPLGLLGFFAYMGARFGQPLRPLRINDVLWHRHFEALGGLLRMPAILERSLHAAATAAPAKLFPASNGPYRAAAVNLVDFGAFAAAVFATVLAIRRLPFAYTAYAVVSLAVFASAPKATEPLMSAPRFVLVLFPLPLAIASWASQRAIRAAVWLACSAAALGILSLQFATGRWVA